MNKSEIAAPINPETEVTREDIAKMAETSLCKVGFATTKSKYGFPEPVRPGPKGKLLYDKAAVAQWLEKNDLKIMTFSKEDRAPLKAPRNPDTGIDSTEVAQLMIGIKPRKFKSYGQSTRVHVPERNDIECPRASLTRFSNNNAEFSSLPSYFSGAFE